MAGAPNYVSTSRRPPDVEDYIDMLRRYRSWLIGPMFAGLVIAVVIGFFWPDTYVSKATMRITPQQISDRLVPSVLNMQIQQRLEQMRQEILSTHSLTELILRPALNLYPKERLKYPMEDVVQEMRTKAIVIQPIEINTPGQPRVTSAFTIQFSYPDRFKAQAVVAQLVTKFMEQNATVSRNNATITANFLGDELKQAKERMDTLEAAITKFKAENLGRLPEQFQANVAQMQSHQMQLSNVNEGLSRDQQQKLQLETQLQNYNTQLNYYNSILEESVSLGGAAAVKNQKLQELNQRIMDTRAGLAAAQEKFTPSHPDIRAAQATLASLEKQYADAEAKELESQAAAPATQPQVKRYVNPLNQRMVNDLQASINVLKTEIQNVNLRMEEKLKGVQELNRIIAQYQARVEGSPAMEGQYISLTRDYGLAKQNYEEMHKRTGMSETAKDLEAAKAGENLEQLDPASAPETPSEPNRLQIAGIGTGMGLLLGIVLAGGKEMKNTSLKNLKDVRSYTNLPVLSSIPLLENALLVRRKRRLLWLAWSSAIIIGTIAMSGSAYYYYIGHGA